MKTSDTSYLLTSCGLKCLGCSERTLVYGIGVTHPPVTTFSTDSRFIDIATTCRESDPLNPPQSSIWVLSSSTVGQSLCPVWFYQYQSWYTSWMVSRVHRIAMFPLSSSSKRYMSYSPYDMLHPYDHSYLPCPQDLAQSCYVYEYSVPILIYGFGVIPTALDHGLRSRV